MLLSCSNGLLKDPRLYNSRKDAGGNSALVVAPEPELDLTGGVDTFDETEEWYNKSDEGFPHTDFDQMSLVGTYFNNSNVPVYAMQAGNVWAARDTAKAEFVHANAPDTTGQGYGISKVHWYQYRGRNPLYAPDGGYNTQLLFTASGNPKLSRFYFYRFTGDTLSPSLDNFLFAVDTYSKLMFAFAKPTESKSVFGNNVPTAWGPTDGEKFLGTGYQFYMYDPVGYVLKEGDGYKVEMYDWFKNNLAKGVYEPTLSGLDKNSKTVFTTSGVASKKPDGAGKSPFNNHTADFFVENMKLLGEEGIEFYRRETTSGGGNGLVLYKYKVSPDGKTITRTAESWIGLPTDTDLTQKTYTVGKGETATKGKVSGECNGTLELADKSRTLRFSNGEVAVAKGSFKDFGPDWLERVKHNPTYRRDNVSYVFSENGKKLVYTDGSKTYTYSFIKQYSNSDRNFAIYWTDDAIASWMGIGYGGFGLYNDDYQIKVTNTSAGGASLVDWAIMKDEADLETAKSDSFASNLKGKTFSLRKKDSSGLYELVLTTYSFGTDNTKAEIDWYTEKTTSSTPVNIVDTNGTTGTIDGQQATLTMPDDGNWTLTINGETYYKNYSDPGPSFLHRVKTRWYQGKYLAYDPHNYVFSDDGKTMYYIYDGKTESYTWNGKPDDTTSTTFNEWKYSIDVTDSEKGKAYNFDYAGLDYDATYKGTAEEARNSGLSFP